ncbi:MAG: hypothetical protein DRI86_03980 [Bacteroidetes bacterium]|nr:MAG: hypothetical protein DRI86_03980 [Bacteroidota bacterium]
MKRIITISIIIIGLLFSYNPIKASHYAGADLTYTCMGGATYKITLSFYKDCSGIAAPNTANINITCASNSALNFSTQLLQVAGTGQELTLACSQAPSACSFNGGNSPNNGHPYGVKEIIYEGFVTMPACSNYEISWSGGARNPITTIITNGNWYIVSKLNSLDAFGNNAPIYNNKLIPICYANQLTTLDYGAIDPDGDSLSYSLYAPYTNGPTPLISVIYNSNYSYTNFLNSSTPIVLDPITGKLSFTATTILSTVIGVKIKQWRNINGVMTNIGTTIRDLTLVVINGTNSTPILSGIDTTNSHTYSPNDTIFEKTFFPNIPIEFDINGFDPDTFNSSNTGNPHIFTIDWNTGIPNATFTSYYNGTDSAYAHFSWYPTNNDIYNSNSFKVIIQDDACPYSSKVSKTYKLNIANTSISININDTTICSNDSISLTATSHICNAVYEWKLNNTIVYSGLDSNIYTYKGSDYSLGYDTITVSLQQQGSLYILSTNYRIINTVHHPQINFSDTGFCTSSSVLLDAGPADVYIWKDQNGSIIGTNQTLEINQTGTYTIYVNGEQNSHCFIIDTFAVAVSSFPQVDIGPDQNLELYDSVSLDAGYAGYKYLWFTGETTPSIIVYGYDLGTGNSMVWVETTNDYCALRDSAYFTVTVGINQANLSSSYSISSNPNNGFFDINIKDQASKTINIEIYDYQGKIIMNRKVQSTGNDNISFDLSKFSKGTYFIILNTPKNVLWKSKIIIL